MIQLKPNRLTIGMLLVLLCSPLAAQAPAKEEKEAAKYFGKWLNEDVVYIITDEEREIFEKLTTAEEKERFIEQFWFRRDSDPSTPANEFREEHYRRLAFVAQHFGSGIPGWKTDRGRIYILFGEPTEKQYNAGGGTYVRPSYEGGGRTATFPFELWRYRQIPGVGDDVEIEFVDRSFSGEFKLALYPWEKDMLLHVDGLGETTAERLKLASRADRPGLHPGRLNDQSYMNKNFGSRFRDRPFERIRQFFDLQRPPEIRQKEMQGIVDTKVSYSLLPFSVSMSHIWIADDAILMPLTIQIANSALTYVDQSTVHKARVAIYGRVTGLLGGVAAEFEDVVASEYRPAYLELGRRQNSLYQKSLLLKPGRYKVELVVKDINSGDLGTLSQSILLPAPDEQKISASPIVLAEQLESLKSFPTTPQSFVIGDLRVVPRVDARFKKSDPLGVYLQVYNASLDESTFEPSISVEYTIRKGDKVVTSVLDQEGKSVEYFSPERLVLARKFPLDQLEEGRYKVTVKVSDAISGQSLTTDADFEVSG